MIVFRAHTEAENIMNEMSVAEYYQERSRKNYCHIDECCHSLLKYIVTLEDSRFYQHHGLQPRNIIMSVLHNLRHPDRKRGASTITQQLAKNIYLTFDKTYSRKLSEIFIAKKIEQELTKDQILELYLNVVYFGNGQYGIKDAASFYFRKKPIDLTDNECVMLISLLPMPAICDPLMHPAQYIKRRNISLRLLIRKHAMTQEEADDIKSKYSGKVLDTSLSKGTPHIWNAQYPRTNEAYYYKTLLDTDEAASFMHIMMHSTKIEEHFLRENPCFKEEKTISVKGVMLHSVGCACQSAQPLLANWNHSSFYSSCVHAFIDGNTGVAYQTLPWDHRAWHCGQGVSGSANNTHISIEMCEPDSLNYSDGANFTCADPAGASIVITRTYEAAVELAAYLCLKFELDPMKDGVLLSHAEGCQRGIACNHSDPEHLWNDLHTGYTMDLFRNNVKDKISLFRTGIDFLDRISALSIVEMNRTGILASVIIAQAILETGYGKSDLARQANNLFGMKTVLSKCRWNTVWDGKSIYTKLTQEHTPSGSVVAVSHDFRKYRSLTESIQDHSAYLLSSLSSGQPRYAGINACSNYEDAVNIIVQGNYSSDCNYAEKLCSIIQRWNLTQYDQTSAQQD